MASFWKMDLIRLIYDTVVVVVGIWTAQNATITGTRVLGPLSDAHGVGNG